jgi:hypothetical protein
VHNAALNAHFGMSLQRFVIDEDIAGHDELRNTQYSLQDALNPKTAIGCSPL